MARDKKHAKGRLDKYYHMAKEQGFRARSAFKLIQLNKKYGFLEGSKCCIDLCAAPGGWLQVAAKYMPKPSIIVGLDLNPIKPIPGVVTFVEDITTEKCRTTLKSQLKHFKADVVLHDGAPNVGTSWLQDAFTQSELVLSSLKLAVQFLAAGGTFVTKVFRSKDYNKLLWVFHQLFGQVEATKPASSRNVSAEIFVVCRGFLAPKKIDPKFLDPKWVFKEMDETPTEELDEKKKKERQGALLNDLLHPEKRRRHRDGYAEGDYTLFNETSVSDFIQASHTDHVTLLSQSSALSFSKDEQGKSLALHPLTTPEIKACCQDLKVLGKKDFKALLKWREAIRLDIGLDTKTKRVKEEEKMMEQEETEEVMLDRLSKEASSMESQLKKIKKKAKERKAKLLMKMRLGMETPKDIGIDASNEGMGLEYSDDDMGMNEGPADGPLFSLSKINKMKSRQPVASDSEEAVEEEEESDESLDSDDDMDDSANQKLKHWESSLDEMYAMYRERQMERDPTALLKAEKKKSKQQDRKTYKEEFEEWYGAEYEKKKQEMDNHQDESSVDEDGDVLLTDSESETEGAPLSNKAKQFFDLPVFKSAEKFDTKKKSKGMFDSEMQIDSQDDSEDEAIRQLNEKASRKRKRGSKAESSDDEKENGKFEIVPAEIGQVLDGSDDEGDYVLKTAADYSLAERLIHPSGKRDLLDEGFNRWAFNDHEDLPSWFVQDEEKHYRPNIPITKEAIQIMKQRMRELDARPIKKVAEAKFRKRYKAMKRAEKIQQKANLIAEDEDLPEGAKAKSIVKLLAKAHSKKQAKKPTLVVAKGSNRGVKGRPKGVKGKYKMVDPRMRKEMRAEKRIKKASKKRKKRVILHIDLDAFYCQVEHVRLGIPIDVPLCVQQWNGLIAVNYASRAKGIKRHCNVQEAKKLCPEVTLVHVATYAEGDIEPQYHLEPSYKTHKVSLEPYRRASAKIFHIFKRYAKTIQRASIDEAYLDVTDEIQQMMDQRRSTTEWSPNAEGEPIVEWKDKGILVGEAVDISYGYSDLQLYLAALVCQKIRDAVYQELGYTCSAGIAHNKTLAKLCSAMNKPNKQTILRESQVLPFMETLPFQKIRHLGGKLGDEVESLLQAEKAGDVWKFTEDELMAKFGNSTGVWLYNIVRGECMEPVNERNIIKSMAACKNFQPPLKNHQEMNHWLSVLSAELFTRAQDDYEINQRWPKTFTFYYRSFAEKKSKSCPFPCRIQITSPDDIYNTCLGLFKAVDLPVVHNLSLKLSGLVKEESSHSIKSFFKQSADAFDMKTRENPANLLLNQQNPSHTGIMKFFTQSSQSSMKFSTESSQSSIDSKENIDDDFTFMCEECHQRIPIQDIQEHQDFHFAAQLQKQMSTQSLDSEVVMKRKSSLGGKVSESAQKKAKSISSFFGPK